MSGSAAQTPAPAITDLAPEIDRLFVDKAVAVKGARERSYDEKGQPDLERTPFHIPDAYARDTARTHASYFEWAASVHPYRNDALQALDNAKRDGARAVKWLPSAMGIDPASARCDAFYEKLARLNLPLISHGGEERAVERFSRRHVEHQRLNIWIRLPLQRRHLFSAVRRLVGRVRAES